jgi:LAO/AO transport system kinase
MPSNEGDLRIDRRSLAQLIRRLDDGDRDAHREAAALRGRGAQGPIVGVTGPAGAGKSTLVDALIGVMRGRGATVGVLAVDPSSPFTGGAFLGDRLRMNRHATDDGVFIRSLASRGHLGGLSRAVAAASWVLAAAGFDRVVIETVGAGQSEVEVAAVAHTTVLVTAPGTGDQVQALKAGLIEAADIVVVNKADLPEARSTAQLMATTLASRATSPDGWRTPVLVVAAATGEGLDVLDRSIDDHFAHLSASRGRRTREERRWRDLLLNVLADVAQCAVRERCPGELEGAVRRLIDGGSDPADEAEALLRAATRE